MSKPLRICHLTSVHLDGDIRIFHKMAKTMASEFEVHVVVPNTQTRLQDGVHIHSFEANTTQRRIRMRQTVDHVFREAVRVNAAIYQLHDPELLRLVKPLQATGAKVIFDAHEDVPKQIMDKYWIPWLFRKVISLVYALYEKRISRRLDGIISVTPSICARFEKANPKVVLIQNFPLPDEFPAPDWSLKKANHFCYIGGLYASRGIKEVVLAMKEVDGHLHLAGSFDDPILQAELEASSAWKKVTFYGQVGRTQIQEIVQKSTVGIVTLHPTPSYKEAYPIKMFEYMAAGCAVLASDFPLYKSLLQEETCGRFVDPEDVREIAQALNDFISNPTQTLAMGQAARKRFETKYSWQQEALKLRQFYLDLHA